MLYCCFMWTFPENSTALCKDNQSLTRINQHQTTLFWPDLDPTQLTCCAASPLAGFARFLHLLSQHSWTDRPLVVDPSTELLPAQHKAIHSQFDAAKAKGGARGFTICTPVDLGGSAWAQDSMSPALRHRLVKLAGRSLQVLQVC